MTTQDHAKLLGVFHLIQAGLQIFSGILVFLIYGGLGGLFLANSQRQEDQIFGGIFIVAAIIIGILMIPFAALYAYSGWKLFKNQPHSKVWTIIASALCLLSFPLGTALGAYGLWFVLGDQGKAFYDGEIPSNNIYSPPPPPNSWQ